ncbi:MAG: gliding motility-associated C-terminal domain-containing protein [Thiohalospira sp.]
MNQKFFLIIFFFFFAVFSAKMYAQPEISGVINAYSKVDSIFSSKDTLLVDDPSLFAAGDTVMIYQAKGADVWIDDNNWETLGSIYEFYKIYSSGKHEIIIIDQVVEAEQKVVLRVALGNHYDVGGQVQLIRVPSYSNVRVTGTLTCDPWDGEKGGVLVLFANDTIYLEADIDVSKKGFRGAEPVLGENDSLCASEDSAYFYQYFYPESSDRVGRKGESVVEYNPLYAKGLGRWGNAGGGGNARFSGGGGGGNGASGGNGGKEDTITCGPSPPYLNETGDGPWEGLGGLKGQSMNLFINDSTIYMGGAGGAGTYTSDLFATRGGNGGGIVIIIGKFLVGNNHDIFADGEDITEVATASGAGGGAGGTIVFDVDSVQGKIDLWVSGGDGGDTEGENLSGPGGGGGAGVISYGRYYNSTNVVYHHGLFGASGFVIDQPSIGTYGATDGNGGFDRLITKLPLTGFLFNSISETHAICEGDTPKLISGSNPRGGDGNYTYSWEFKTNNTDWSSLPDTTKDLQPGPLYSTTYYRRTVESDGIEDISATIRIVVHERIDGNKIFPDDTVSCIGNLADTITGTKVEIGGDGFYNYLWQSSFDLNNWNPIDELNDTVCLPGEVFDTTFIRRVVQSGACYDTTRVVEIIGLPQIENNNLSEHQEICLGQIPEEIIGEQPINGLGPGTYKISWQESVDGLNWNTIADSSRLNLAPSNLVETTYYRRIVESDDCLDISDSVKINVLPLIDNNLVTNDATIHTCYGTEPELLTGTGPEGGDNEYHYQWIKSTDGNLWTEINENGYNKDYQSPELTTQTFFRRITRSGQDSCCVDTSNMITVNIYPLPVATIDNFEDTICSGEEVTLYFNITSGQSPYNLTFTDGEEFTTINSINTTETNYNVNPATSVESKIFDYSIDSVSDANGCIATDLSGLTKIITYGWPESDAGSDAEECVLTHQMEAGISLGQGEWSQVDGPGNTSFNNVAQATTELSVDLAGTYEYQWKEVNWQCADSATVELMLYDSPYNVDAGPDTSLFFTREYELRGSYINPDNVRELISTWSIDKGYGSILNPGDTVTIIERLTDENESGIRILWAIEKGVCEIITDSVNITLRPIFTPTGFTPNGDGVNDYLKFTGLDFADENELVIFNRWGTEVFRQKNFSNNQGWDAKNDNGYDLPEDTYYYILTVVNTDPETNKRITDTHKGFIVIKRH